MPNSRGSVKSRGKELRRTPSSRKNQPKTKKKDNDRVQYQGKSTHNEEDEYEYEESYDEMEHSDTRDIEVDPPVDVSDLSHTPGSLSTKYYHYPQESSSETEEDTTLTPASGKLVYHLAPRPGQPGYKPRQNTRTPRSYVQAMAKTRSSSKSKAPRSEGVAQNPKKKARRPDAEDARRAQALEEQLRQLRAQVEEEKALKEKAIAEKAEALAQKGETVVVVSRGKKPDHLDFNSPYAKTVQNIIKLKLWKFFKFMPTDPKQLSVLCQGVLKLLKEQKVPQALCVKSSVEIAQWAEENHDLITKKVNDNRAAVMNGMKKEFEIYWQCELARPEKGEQDTRKLPSLADIEKVATRSATLDLEGNQGDRTLAILWYDRILTKACNNTVDYDERRTKKVSDIPGMTIQTEAHALTVYANYHEAWTNHFRLKSQYGWKKVFKNWSTNKPKKYVKGTDHTLDGEIIHLHDPKHMAKWTEQNAGAVKGGAWTLEGRQKYNHYLKMITNARKVQSSVEFEQDLLDKMAELGDVETESEKPTKIKKKTPKQGPKDIVDMGCLAETLGFDLNEFGVDPDADASDEGENPDPDLPDLNEDGNAQTDDDDDAQNDDDDAQNDEDGADDDEEDGADDGEDGAEGDVDGAEGDVVGV